MKKVITLAFILLIITAGCSTSSDTNSKAASKDLKDILTGDYIDVRESSRLYPEDEKHRETWINGGNENLPEGNIVKRDIESLKDNPVNVGDTLLHLDGFWGENYGDTVLSMTRGKDALKEAKKEDSYKEPEKGNEFILLKVKTDLYYSEDDDAQPGSEEGEGHNVSLEPFFYLFSADGETIIEASLLNREKESIIKVGESVISNVYFEVPKGMEIEKIAYKLPILDIFYFKVPK